MFQNRGKKGHVETFFINPKCVKLGELYGETDPNTFEWSDGLIALATRKFSRSSIAKAVDIGEELPRPPTTETNSPSVTVLDYFNYIYLMSKHTFHMNNKLYYLCA